MCYLQFTFRIEGGNTTEEVRLGQVRIEEEEDLFLFVRSRFGFEGQVLVLGQVSAFVFVECYQNLKEMLDFTLAICEFERKEGFLGVDLGFEEKCLLGEG